MKKIKIDFKKEALEELKDRIKKTRFPDFKQKDGWEFGTPVKFLKNILDALADSYELWKIQEEHLNSFPQFICTTEGVAIHFFHSKIILGEGNSKSPS